jgi:signal transduction histidine kinase
LKVVIITANGTAGCSRKQGLDIKVLDISGKEVIPAHQYMHTLSPGMRQRMEELFHIHSDISRPYSEIPVYSGKERIGLLMARSFQKKTLAEKEAIFKARVRHFLYVYLLIAGLGTVIVGFLISQYLSKPVRSLKKASEKIGEGVFSVRIDSGATDEVGDLARTFNRMAESLQKEELLRDHLMSNIAHELRTPLTIMKTHVEAMSDGVVKDRGKALNNIAGEIERLIALVKGIEDITAAEASFFSRGITEEINLKEFLFGIAEDLSPSFAEKKLSLKILSDRDIPVRTDVEKLERIVRNLLSNALKFTDHGGATLDYGLGNRMFRIEVADTGRGISEKDLPFIFNRFFRSSDAAADGLGLGLSIVKELVAVMGGRVEAASLPGKGSTFKIMLPFAV